MHLVMANGAVVVDVSLLLGWMYSVRYAIEKAIQPKIDCIICSMLNTNWYSNIGTTHHTTSELNNLFIRAHIMVVTRLTLQVDKTWISV
jgi:hypothetical protein